MYEERFMANDDQVKVFFAAMNRLGTFLGGVPYTIDHRIELTVKTEDKRLIEAVRALVTLPDETTQTIPSSIGPVSPTAMPPSSPYILGAPQAKPVDTSPEPGSIQDAPPHFNN